jgi:hypothetical protein
MKNNTPFDLKNRQDITQIQKKLLDTIGSEALNILMQGISEDIYTLSQGLVNKQDKFIGFTGSLTIITNIDFAGETTTSKIMTISNGIITGVE